MRYVQMVIGVLLLIKGINEAIALPAALASVHAGAAATAFSTGYTAGQMTGMVVGTLAVLAGGVILIINGWARRRGRAAVNSAA